MSGEILTMEGRAEDGNFIPSLTSRIPKWRLELGEDERWQAVKVTRIVTKGGFSLLATQDTDMNEIH